MAGEDSAYDLLVIGGGINGAGIARDAAMRGLRVLLVEQDDWGAGTSSKSSMLAHGGLRYLEQFELGLVHEALQERELLFGQAPHLVHPLEFLYPLYPHIASRHTVRVGLWLYDVLSHGKSVPRRNHLKADEVMARAPGIQAKGLRGGATYHDGQWSSVERFVQELVVDARSHGAVCLNHVRVKRLHIRSGRCVGAALEPAPSIPEAAQALRDAGIAGPDWAVKATATINAAGPWVDQVLDECLPTHRALIRTTKGIHIVVPRFVETALIIRTAKDQRTFFILPWQEHCIIGTTDTDFEGDPGTARATKEEVRYLQDAARWYFPKAPLDEIRWTYAGVRPLVKEEGLTESNVTRKHRLHDHSDDGAADLWSTQGGKLTTYRHLAEEALDLVARKHGWSEEHPTRAGTLPGGPLLDWPTFRPRAIATAMHDHGLGATIASHLVDTYGARWQQVVAAGRHDGLGRITPGRPEVWCEVDHAVQAEQALTVADVMLRRTQLGLAPGGRREVAKAVAARMQGHLGWSPARVREELRRYDGAIAVLAVP